MSYESVVYRILIASPSDVEEEREIVARIIQDWNDLNSFNKKIVLLPIKWETHSSPTYGIRPQEAINNQLVDDCDLLIGFFWTKIGTPTGKELGGTIEEIKRVSKAGKPVMLYFSKRGKDPSQIDISQLQLLNKFKEEVYSTALVENFNSVVDFRDKLSRQLEMKIRELQDRKESNKDLISFSFVDRESRKITDTKLEKSIERVEIDKKRELEIFKHPKAKKNKGGFKRALVKYLNRRNNIPVVLGVKNNVKRIFGNVNIELRIKSKKKNSLVIENFDSYDESIIEPYRLDYFVTDEIQREVRKLFNDNYKQISENSWEFKIKSFTLLPGKMKILENLLLLFPKDTDKIEFSIHLFSDNILQPIESSCELKIDFKKRQITDEEIAEIIEKLPDYDEDEAPF